MKYLCLCVIVGMYRRGFLLMSRELDGIIKKKNMYFFLQNSKLIGHCRGIYYVSTERKVSLSGGQREFFIKFYF
jgi:hypothetical protein